MHRYLQKFLVRRIYLALRRARKSKACRNRRLRPGDGVRLKFRPYPVKRRGSFPRHRFVPKCAVPFPRSLQGECLRGSPGSKSARGIPDVRPLSRGPVIYFRVLRGSALPKEQRSSARTLCLLWTFASPKSRRVKGPFRHGAREIHRRQSSQNVRACAARTGENFRRW